MAELALLGYPQLAADTILNEGNAGSLSRVIGDSIRQLNLAFVQERQHREKCVRVILETAINLVGMERKRAGFSEQEAEEALNFLIETLSSWEEIEKTESTDSVQFVVRMMLNEMRMVLAGKSLVAKLAMDIERSLQKDNLARSFVSSSKNVIQSNVYCQIVNTGLSKFGNDSATGLRWARHLGATQVSSNPVIAARAFDEIPDLWRTFGSVVANHPEWHEDIERYGDEIALYGTIVSLLPNVLDFRPIALLSDFREGMVSIQLNPLNAKNVEDSLRDALRIYTILQEILEVYDDHLALGKPNSGKGRPNVVFKVSTAEPEARELTEKLDRIGLGTNNTVTFTVSQEVEMSLVAMKGLATAQKLGIHLTRVYITNMEGRLEDHLRECRANELLKDCLGDLADREVRLKSIAGGLAAVEDLQRANGSFEERLKALCQKKYLKSLSDEWFVEALRGSESISNLEQMEQDIRMAGIFVTRRVFKLVFSPEVKAKWIDYVANKYGMTQNKATKVIESIDILPSSKRRENDTYLVLGNREISNLTNTEFPDHQLKVSSRSLASDFRLSAYESSILSEPDQATLSRLLQMDDFRKAYFLTPNLVKELRRVGIPVSEDEIGGVAVEDWPSFGPCRKTMIEFNSAYASFKHRLLDFIRKKSEDAEPDLVRKSIAN